jgi:hypothetical protein
MSRQMTLDEMRTIIATDRAIENAERGAGDEWCAMAYDAVLHCAASLETFTADDVRKALASERTEMRALGAIVRRAARARRIVPTGEYRSAPERVSCHSRPMRVWRRAE